MHLDIFQQRRMGLKFRPLRAASDELLTLDLLRFIASAAVVFHHSHEFFYPEAQRPSVFDRTQGLALFVDLFFMISGFVIAYVYHGRVHTLPDIIRFFQRRIGRLVPLHWLTLLLSIALWVIIVRLGEGQNAPSFAPACIATTALLLHDVIPCGSNLFFNGVTWSISAEMMMYALFPILILVSSRYRRLFLIGAIGFWLAISWYIFARDASVSAWTASWGVGRALPAFAIGVGVAYNSSWFKQLPYMPGVIPLALVAVIAAMLTGMPGFFQLSLVYFIAVMAMIRDLQGRVSPIVRHLAPLGQLTYSIYLWHLLFVMIILNALGDKILHLRIGMLPLALFCYALIICWSYVSFIYIETPARKWIDGLWGGRRKLDQAAEMTTAR